MARRAEMNRPRRHGSLLLHARERRATRHVARLPARGRRSGRSAVSVARLAALAAGFSGELRVLREAALLVRDALPALAPCDRRERAVLREAALGTGHTLPALASRLSRQAAILREAALLVRDGLASHTGDLPLAFCVHRCEAAMRQPSVRSLSHCLSPYRPTWGRRKCRELRFPTVPEATTRGEPGEQDRS